MNISNLIQLEGKRVMITKKNGKRNLLHLEQVTKKQVLVREKGYNYVIDIEDIKSVDYKPIVFLHPHTVMSRKGLRSNGAKPKQTEIDSVIERLKKTLKKYELITRNNWFVKQEQENKKVFNKKKHNVIDFEFMVWEFLNPQETIYVCPFVLLSSFKLKALFVVDKDGFVKFINKDGVEIKRSNRLKKSLRSIRRIEKDMTFLRSNSRKVWNEDSPFVDHFKS